MPLAPKHFRPAFTLIEMLTTVAALIILMGLAVSLAREVRRRSADMVTRELLAELDAVLAQYQKVHDRAVPQAAPLLPAALSPGAVLSGAELPDSQLIARAARKNNEEIVALLRRGGGLNDEVFGKIPNSMYDDLTLRDAWGSPIVFMPGMHPAIGMAADNNPFFFSAGPDRNYLTREDNLYSYEGR